MRVVLFASALLVAAGQALQLESPIENLAIADVNTLAQTDAEQMPGMGGGGGMPDAKQLKEKAAQAIDKDDKKKMGTEAHTMFHKIKKILSSKNEKARDMAGVLEDVMSGKPIAGIDKPKEDDKDDKPETPEKTEPDTVSSDNADKLKGKISEIQTKLEARSKDRIKESELKLQKVVDTLKLQMEKMKDTMKHKSELDQKEAVAQYQIAQRKTNLKIYDTMRTQLPKQMRGVIANAAMAFRKGKVTRREIKKLLQTHFGNAMFQQILRCVQGDLDFCSKINMQKWSEASNKDIVTLSKKAKHIEEKAEQKKKEFALTKINKIIAKKSEETHSERKAEQQIQAEAKRLTDKIIKDKNMDTRQKQETINEVKDQVSRAVHDLHSKRTAPKVLDSESLQDVFSKPVPPPPAEAPPAQAPPAQAPPAPPAQPTAPKAHSQTETAADGEEAKPTGLAQLLNEAKTAAVTTPAAPVAAPAPAAPAATAAPAPAPAAAPASPPAATAPATVAAAPPAPAAAVPDTPAAKMPTKPREATVLEKEIKDSEIKLRLMKPKAIELLEADEAQKASKAKREPLDATALSSAEHERVTKEKDDLSQKIKKDQARLEEVYPDSAKAAVKEAKQQEGQKALNAMSTMGDKLSSAETHTFMKKIKEAEAAEDDNDEHMEKEIAKEVKKQEEANAVSENLIVALAKQKKVEAAEKAEEAKEEEQRLKRKKEAEVANAKADEKLKAANAALTNAKNTAIASKLPSEKPLATPESQGLVKSLTPEKKTAAIEAPAPVMKPGQISKELINLASKTRIQYKVPKKSDDFAFAQGKSFSANEAPARSSLLLKKDPKAKKEAEPVKKGQADQVKIAAPSADTLKSKTLTFSKEASPAYQRQQMASYELQHKK